MTKADSVLQKLKNRARKTGFSYQLILQLFCQEEFLRRLAISDYKEKLILKGGLFLFTYTNFQSRPTMDIDFLMKDISNEEEMMLKVINEIINKETGNDYIEFQIKAITNITEHKEYHGIRIKMIGLISNTKTPFDIDFGIGDIIIPKPELRRLSVQLEEFVVPEVLTYSLESTIAEKWDAIISRMESSSRMKDYYDIYYLVKHYNFEGRKLQEAIYETLQNRGTSYERDTMDKVEELYKDEAMLKRWKAFCKNSLELDIDFKDVLAAIMKFIKRPFIAIINEDECFENWNANNQKYE